MELPQTPPLSPNRREEQCRNQNSCIDVFVTRPVEYTFLFLIIVVSPTKVNVNLAILPGKDGETKAYMSFSNPERHDMASELDIREILAEIQKFYPYDSFGSSFLISGDSEVKAFYHEIYDTTGIVLMHDALTVNHHIFSYDSVVIEFLG